MSNVVDNCREGEALKSNVVDLSKKSRVGALVYTDLAPGGAYIDFDQRFTLEVKF